MSYNHQIQKIESKTLDHLGLVAGMYDELGIGDIIDEAIEQDEEKRFVSIGQAVKAMVLNGLGFVNQRLYLFPKVFSRQTGRSVNRRRYMRFPTSLPCDGKVFR